MTVKISTVGKKTLVDVVGQRCRRTTLIVGSVSVGWQVKVWRKL